MCVGSSHYTTVGMLASLKSSYPYEFSSDLWNDASHEMVEFLNRTIAWDRTSRSKVAELLDDAWLQATAENDDEGDTESYRFVPVRESKKRASETEVKGSSVASRSKNQTGTVETVVLNP